MADAKLPDLTTATPAVADLLYFVDVSDTTEDPTGSSRKATVAAVGGVAVATHVGEADPHPQYAPGGAEGYVQIYASGAFSGAARLIYSPFSPNLFLFNTADDHTPLAIKGFAGQSVPLTEWLDSTNAVVASIGPTGEITGIGSGITGMVVGQVSGAAPLASPALTGTPTAPTAAGGTNTTQLATTAFVRAEVAALAGTAPTLLDTLGEISDALGDDPNFAATMTTALANKQPLEATLTGIAATSPVADQLIYATGNDMFSVTSLTSFGRTLVALADYAALRTGAGLVIGTNVQAFDADLSALAALSGTNTIYYRSAANTWTAVTIGGLLSFTGGTLNVSDAELTAIAGLTSAADTVPYFTGSGTAALATLTTAGRALIDDADAAAQRVTIGLATIARDLFTSAPADGTIVFTAKASFAFTINQIRGLKTTAGTLTMSIQINGTNVTGLGGLSVTSTPQDATATAANAVAVGDRVTVVIASSSSPANLEFTLQATR